VCVDKLKFCLNFSEPKYLFKPFLLFFFFPFRKKNHLIIFLLEVNGAVLFDGVVHSLLPDSIIKSQRRAIFFGLRRSQPNGIIFVRRISVISFNF